MLAPEPQTAAAVIMVRPAAFGFNAEAARSNAFAAAGDIADVQARALAEFDALAAALSGAGVEVVVVEDEPDPPCPDAVFGNNWMSFHADGTAVLYPLAGGSRRCERRPEAVEARLRDSGLKVERWLDLSWLEPRDIYLESTGSLVLDRPNRIAYACLSARTHPGALDEFEVLTGYRTHRFTARDRAGRPAYHTNVVMSLGARFAAVSLEMVDEAERAPLRTALEQSGRTVIDLGRDQVSAFAANILELRTLSGSSVVAMSTGALNTLADDQRRLIEELGGPIVHAAIPTIEQVGGGGVRCMLTEAPLPRRPLPM